MQESSLLFSVFTPTYNREHTLRRLYDSLCLQDNTLFEWIVVDDGSSDNTAKLIKEFQSLSKFPIKYIYKENGGKHTAHNAALEYLRGELFLPIDSDDELTKDCLVNLKEIWHAIPTSNLNEYAGIIGNIIQVHKGGFQEISENEDIEGNFFDLILQKKIKGEKLHIIKSDLMKENPFPVKEGNTEYIIEGNVWLKVTKDKKIIYSSKFYRKYHLNTQGVETMMAAGASVAHGSWGKALYCAEELKYINFSNLLHFIFFIKSSIKFNRYFFHSNLLFSQRAGVLERKIVRLLCLLTLPAGYLVSKYDYFLNK